MSSFGPVAAGGSPLDERVAHEQLRGITEQAARILVSLAVMDSYLIWLLSRADLFWQAVIWVAAGAALQAWRWSIPYRHLKRGASAIETVSSLVWWLGAVGWARAAIMIPLFMLPVGEVQYIFTMILVGQMAGAVGSMAGLVRGFLSWGLPVALTAATAWGAQANIEGISVGGLLLLLFAVLTGYVRANGDTLGQLVGLAQEKEELAASLQVERDRAQAASQSKTRFFAAASHDLRQPLYALSINATSLEVVARRQGDPTIKDLSQSISRALHASNDLLQGLLDISRLDSGAMSVELRAVDAREMLRTVADQFGASAAQRGIELRLDLADVPGSLGQPPLLVSTDSELMTRVLNNLVSNAVKFTRKGHVRLYLRQAAKRPDGSRGVVFGVCDTGCGIPAAEREKVFEEFYQVDNPSRDRSQGLGLGLSIVQRSVALLGASMTLHSSSGEGTEVEVEVPIAAAGLERAHADTSGAESFHSLWIAARVLVIDDEVEILKSLESLLPLLGCELRCAQSLAGAQVLLDAGFYPEILLVDYRLRGESGIDAIASLRTRLGPIPALVITGDTTPEKIQGEPSNDWVLVHKPIDGLKLAELIALALNHPKGHSRI